MENQKQDLSKIDFSKCKLPEWYKRQTQVTRVGEDIHVTFVCLMGWVARKQNGEWRVATDGSTRAELDALYAICAQVDTFIVTELAKLAAPEWVDVKWTEVARLEKHGATVEFWSVPVSAWHRSVCAILGENDLKYRVDLKTVPAGVALYEPDWVDVGYWQVCEMLKSGIRVEWLNGCNVWVPANVGIHGHAYHADRKTFPPGYEPKKPVKLPTVKAPEGYEWEINGGKIELRKRGIERETRHWVPLSAQERDCDVACVAAFDEQNKIPSFSFTDNGVTIEFVAASVADGERFKSAFGLVML